MKTQPQAVDWLNQQVGKGLNFDGAYGQQCFDFFNYYYQFLTGNSPYNDGYGVPGAKDIWNVGTDKFDKIADSASLVPQPGDVLIYGSTWGGGYGHVEVVISSDANGSNIVGQNLRGNATDPVTRVYRTWAGMRGLIGVMRPKFNQGDDDMIKGSDRDLLDRLTQKLKFWKVPYDLNHEMDFWTGQDFRSFLNGGLGEASAEWDKRAKAVEQVPVLSGQITGLTQTVNEKQAEIDTLIDENSQLKAKLAQAGSDSVQLNALGTSLNWLIIRLGLKK